MPGVTKEQIARAKEWDLLSYLQAREPEQRKTFALPKKNPYASNVISYLQRRGIDADIIRQCMEEGILYESRRRHNCVFVGRDTGGKARYAFLRGTGEVYKQDVAGSDKRYGFCLPAADPDSPYLAVAESPIDALAVASLVKRQGGDCTRAHYLSLGGTAPRALLRFLKDHPLIRYLSLCLDNDAAGKNGMERIQAAITEDRDLGDRIGAVVKNPPHESCGCKDYAQLLQGMKEKQERKREYDIAI